MFFKIREKVLQIWEELEVEPEGKLELTIAKGDIKTFVLSEDNMKLLEEFQLKVSMKATCTAMASTKWSLFPKASPQLIWDLGLQNLLGILAV